MLDIDMDYGSMGGSNEWQLLQKRREVNGFKGFSNTDNLSLINDSTLFRVNDKIDKLQDQIKNLVIKYKEELKKIIKRCQKHKQMIMDELKAEQDKQKKLYEEAKAKNEEEIERLQKQKVADELRYEEEEEAVVNSKEKLLNYVITENDDLEREILRLNDNLVQELNKVEQNHKSAIQELVGKYEKSLNNMKGEITSTVKKLKESAAYYETVLKGNEEGYENEIESNEQTKVKNDAQNKALDMEEEVKATKENHFKKTLEHKKIDNKTKDNLNFLIKEKAFLDEISDKIQNTLNKKEQCQKMIGLKKIHIEHFQKEKNNLENLIIVLANRIQELNDETEPLQKRKQELETTVKNSYSELIHEFNANKILELEVESFENKVRVINETIVSNSRLHGCLQSRVNSIKKEIQHLSQNVAVEVADLSRKIHIILENIKMLINAKSAKEIEEHPLKFPKVATPPWRSTKDKNDPNLYTEAELCRQRNNLFTQITEHELKFKKSHNKNKDVKMNKRMQQDNVKLIEEFNALKFENKKVKNHQRLIEKFMETVLGPENFQNMLLSIENNAIMGKPKQAIKLGRHRRKASGQPPKVPNLGESKSMGQFTTEGARTNRNFDQKNFKAILEEFDKNKQNVMHQNKIMDDIQRKMLSIGKEFNLQRGLNPDLQLDTEFATPVSMNTGSQSHRVIPKSITPDSSSFTNFIPTSGRSSEIRAQAKIEASTLTSHRGSMRKRSLPTIVEREEQHH